MKLRTTLLILLGLVVVTLAVYSRAAYFPFSVMDDGDYVTENQHVLSGLTVEGLRWAFTSFHASNWHPLTWISLMIDSHIFGRNPMGFHLVNVVLHALNASLLFLLFTSMTGAIWRSAFVAACFALHPLHVESVAWIAERKDVLSTLFWMLTLLCYSSYVRHARRSMYILSLAAFTLGLMTKPMLVTIPVILLLLDFWPFERLKIPLRRKPHRTNQEWHDNSETSQFIPLLLEKVPFVLLAAISSFVTMYAQKTSISPLASVPLYARIANVLWSLLMYMQKMLFPSDLAVFYPLVLVPPWQAGCAAVVLGVIVWITVKYGSRFPYLTAGWFWYLITLLPVIGIIQVGRQSMADRYTYIPLIGVFTMVSWCGADFSERYPQFKNVIRVVAVGVIMCLSVTTWTQLGYWRDNFTLFSHALEVTTGNSFAHNNLALVYEQRGQPELATAEYEASLAIEPRDPKVHFFLGFLLDAQGRRAEGMRHFEEAIKLNPDFAQAHFSLGIALGKIGRIRESIKAFNEAIRLEPDNSKYLNNLGIVLAQQGMLDEAIKLFSKALQVNPQDEKASENLQIALQQKSQMPAK